MARPVGFYKKDGKTRPITKKKQQSRYRGQKQAPSWKTSSINDLRRTEGSARKTWEKYTITFQYHDGKTEKFVVGARDSDDALNQALKVRKIKKKPVKVIIDDSIASVASAIASGVTQVVGGVVTGVAKGLSESAQVRIKQQAREIEELVKMTQSPNKYEREMATKKLEKKYPDAYERLAVEQV